MTITLLLLLAAFIVCILSALGKAPGWLTDMLVILALLVRLLPA